MDILAGITARLGDLLVDATIKQARYLFCFNNIVKELESEETNLKGAQNGINEKVEKEREIHRAIVIEKDVEKWLEDVDKEMADVPNLKAKIDEKKSCLNGLCPNWGSRYWLGRKAEKKTSILSNLQDQSKKFSTVALPKPLPSDKQLPTPRHFMSFETTESACNEIIKALKTESTKMVGLHGLGGVGKTTLAKFVGNQLRQQKIFDEVGIATVSQNPNIIDVQSKLVKSLGWPALKEEDAEARAKRLMLMFSESKSRKILIIIDDVWNELNLETVGIPVGDSDNCCKILLTTRLQPVFDLMDCDTRIQLGILKREEGLALLRNHAGIDDSTLIDVSEQVADECKGLPLAIKAVGSALRGKGVDQWNVALRKLKDAKLNKIEGIYKDDQDVYDCLKFSYDFLNGEDSKSFFLFCSLFPEDYEIYLDDLVGCAMVLACYPAESIEETRSLVRGTIKELKASSLLLETGNDRSLKMHDIVRDVALWIGSVEKKYFTGKVGMGLEERAAEEGLKEYRGISLVANAKEQLPSSFVCPNLHILRLENTVNNYKLQVPEHFFKGMPALKVVSIIGGVLSLKSLEFLTNLQVLQLIQCDVSDAAFLGKLKRLQILYLNESPIEIPEELGDELSRLKILYVGAGSISPITIKKFPQLEEFYGEIEDWKVEGISSEESYAGPAELNSQTSDDEIGVDDEIMEVETKKVVCLPKDFMFQKLQRYAFRKGSEIECHDDTHTRCLTIDNYPTPGATSLDIFSALYQTLEFLHLSGVIGCHNIVPSIDQRGLNELAHLSVKNCTDLECIMDASQSPHGMSRNPMMLSRLSRLYMEELPKLKWIWKAPVQHVSLRSLTKLKVSCCDNLTYIFTLPLARSLEQLKSLKVSKCERLECIVEAKFDHNEGEISVGDGNTMLGLPLLRELKLEELPELISFCSENYYSTWPALEDLYLESCPNLTVNNTELEANLQGLGEKLQNLHVSNCSHLRDTVAALLKHGLKNLETLNIRELGVQLQALLYHEGPTHMYSLQNLTHLTVDGCTKLRHLLSSTLARNLLQLEYLAILNCLELEQIIDEDEDEHHLQPVCFPKLGVIIIEGCPKLKRVFHISVALSLRNLFYLRIESNYELEEVFWHKDGADVMDYNEVVMKQLWILSLVDLPNLTNFWPAGYQIPFPSAKDETVRNCPKLRANSKEEYDSENCGAELSANLEGEDDLENSGAEALQTIDEADASRKGDANEDASEAKGG